MKKKKHRVIWIDRCLIRNPIYVGLCISEKAFNAELKRLNLKKSSYPKWIADDANATAHFFSLKGKYQLVCIVSITGKGKKLSVWGTLIHEAVHIWQEVKKELEEKHPSFELEAISIQSIAQELMEKYEELKGD